ncbi:YtxH domain-containing protein [Flavobacterium agrisoli]|uniref:YtxH domain-containing protein n=1 Tax=Flavobacterium agrisoli TaxID=2793066 RepID=A0A934PLU9_9FLAO|nr:YtxH domain-containing protein [Flavobacterium agrisoli]MBK0369640.1 YtxH domain-containing protein [Flavobacterium agrisoli]
MSRNTGQTVLALVTGAAIGAGIGILFAPAKGSETRKKLKEGLDDTSHNLKDTIAATTDALKSKLSHVKKDAEGTYEDLLSNMSYKTEEVISFLESKLADLKSKNTKYQK